MTDDTMPAAPALTGNSHVDSRARQEHFSQLTAWFERNGSRPAAPVQRAPTPTEAEERVAEFDREQRAAGTQRSDTLTGEIDQRALKFLDDAMKSKPAAERTSQWLTVWERDYASVLEGRRYGETPEQFAARKAGVATNTQAPAAEAADDVVGVDSSVFTVAEHGYSLPPLPEGVALDREVTEGMLGVARAAGIPQRVVDAYFRALMEAT